MHALQAVLRLRQVKEKSKRATMPKQISFESVMVASGVKFRMLEQFGWELEWGNGQRVVCTGDNRISHVRLVQFLAKKLGLSSGQLLYPVVPDEIYKNGGWLGSVSADWEEFVKCLKAKDPVPLSSENPAFRLPLEEFYDSPLQVAWCKMSRTMHNRYMDAKDEWYDADKEILFKGYVPAHEGRPLMPELEKTPLGPVLSGIDWKYVCGDKTPSLSEVLGATDGETGEDDDNTGNILPPTQEAVKGAEGGVKPEIKAKGRLGINAQHHYAEAGIVTLFGMTLSNDAFMQTLKNPSGSLQKWASQRDKRSGQAAIGRMKQQGIDGKPVDFQAMLMWIDQQARGDYRIAALLFRQMLTDFDIDLLRGTLVNRSAASEKTEGAF